MIYNIENLDKLSIQELEEIQYKVNETIKKKKDGKRKPKAKTKPEERKPSFNIKKSKYVELQIRDEHGKDGKPKCFYIGLIGSSNAEVKLNKYAETWPDIIEEYRKLVKNYNENLAAQPKDLQPGIRKNNELQNK